ncbi:MAG: helix-turn-helix transcriptional regulator [Deltaproteobacteria bacterium]
MFAHEIDQSGKNRTEWAATLGISKSHLSDLLSGHRKPSLDLAARIERETGGRVLAVSWVPAPTQEAAA